MTVEQDQFNHQLGVIQEASKALIKMMECPHIGSEYGNCWDCRNTGVAATCQEDIDLVDKLEDLNRLIKHMKGE